MTRRIRMFEVDRIYFVTCRTFQARFLLTPGPQANALIGGILARAVERHGVQIFGFVFLSNHFHLLIRSPHGPPNEFMRYLLVNLSRKIGRLHDWSGALWHRRYSAEPVLDDGAQIGRLRYILSHGVKEHLVNRCEEWPGISCLPQLLSATARAVFSWFNWTKRWNARRRPSRNEKEDLTSREWAEDVPLTLAALPCWADLPPGERIRHVRELIAGIESEHADATVLGAARVQAQDPHEQPVAAAQRPAPFAHASNATVLDEHVEAYRGFVRLCAAASEQWRRGLLAVAFPPNAFRPPLFSMAGATAQPPVPFG